MELGEKLGQILSRKPQASNSGSGQLEERLATSCRQFFTQKIEFTAAKGPDSHLKHLKTRYTPLNKGYKPLSAMESPSRANVKGSSSESDVSRSTKNSDGVPEPKMILYTASQLVMGWREARSVGSGLCNLGNTCFLNSVLQCLTYTPPLFNYVASGQHRKTCNTQGFCAMCEFEHHCTRVFNPNSGQVKPIPIVKNLRAIARHFHQGRQEDAHEFLRYFIDGLQKSCLQGLPQKLDVYSKATTLVHQIFGGYHRSQVKCLACSKMSDTFDPLLDISVDIKNSPTLHKALQHYIKPDLLEGDNSYACPFCKKMTRAQKKLTVHRLPNVLTIQLKRFDYNSMFGGKVNKQVAFTEHINMRPFMSDKEGPAEWYRLYGVLVHFGYSCHSGHYYCYIRNSNNVWFCMNDSQVTQVSLSNVLQQEAYLLFYIRDKDYKPINVPFPPGSPALKLSSSHFKADPNFLARSNKPFPSSSSQRTNLDKTGTPLVRLKPTGVVQPSPQKDTPTNPKPPTLPTKGQSSLSTTAGGFVTPKSKSSSVSPNGSSSGGSGGNGMTSPMMREFSIPLRKLSNTITPSRTGADKSDATKTNIPPPPPPPATSRQQATLTAATSLQFTPRQISAPPPKNKKKMAVVSSASLNQGTEKASVDERETKGGASDVVQEAGIQAAPSIASQSAGDKIASKDDESATFESTESKAAPAFKVIPSEEPATTGGGGFIGPLLPSSPSPAQPQSPLRVTPFSLKPSTTSPVSSKAVAMVPPQPQAREKPVARVRPNPHHQEDEESAPKGGGPPSSAPAPHLNAVSPWKVRESSAGEVFGPLLPDDMDYNSAAHGWSVSAIPGGDEGQEKGEQQTTPHGHGKAKKHKKKKKHRKREEGASGESEGERGGGGKRERSKENSSKKVRRERDERGRRHYSHSPERGHHHHHDHHDPHRSPERTPHHDKHRNYRRHGHRDRDRERETQEHYGRRHRRYSKGNTCRYPHHDRSRSHSRSRSRSPLNHDPEDRYYHHSRDRHRTPPSRHAHQSHHYAPYSDAGEGGGGHWKNHHYPPYYRPKYSSDSGERRVNIKSEEARRRERKRSHYHDTMSEEETDHKKYKKSVPSVAVVDWDSGGGAGKVGTKWDGAPHSSTMEQLTSLSRRALGENVKSWDGGENTIDSSKMEGEGGRRERDSWDAELDKGKVKKMKKVHHENQFNSDRNRFQEFQNQRNISSQINSDTH